MSDEATFLAAIAAAPDDDTPRLAFADWLDEHDRPAEAELIRVQCELEPVRERHGEPRTDRLLAREEELLSPRYRPEQEWWCARVGYRGSDELASGIEYRRGFVAGLKLPAQWLLAHGAALRGRHPLLRKLVLFRVNGWGERLAACPHLRGVRELDLGCWYGDADAAAFARSPHLADLEVLTYWGDAGDPTGQLRALAGSPAWPRLREFRVMIGYPEFAGVIDAAAGRPVARVIEPRRWLFPFAADFHSMYLVGRLPGGVQFFARDPGEYSYTNERPDELVTTAQLFDPDGNPTGQREVRLPPELWGGGYDPGEEMETRWNRQADLRRRREQYLRESIGFEPAFIRVKHFWLDEVGPYRGEDGAGDRRGYFDDPDTAPEEDYDGPFGRAGSIYRWVTRGMFTFHGGDWHCDGRGRVVST